jgi:uncharacterized protein YdhG (YjbR/CyaY superfamily)
MAKSDYSTIYEYIKQFPPEFQKRMELLRSAIREEAPDAEEKISWGMPTFYLKGNLVHFAAHKNHIGFYPGPSGVQAFLKETTEFKTSKGAVQLPMDKPLSLGIIRRVVRLRAEENLGTKK